MNQQLRLASLCLLIAGGLATTSPSLAACTDCGTVSSIRTVHKGGEGSGAGAVMGGVAGALVGNQFGKGGDRTAMTVVGAGGGAYAGHQVEKSMNKKTEWLVQVKMDAGPQKTITYHTAPPVETGDRVKLRNGKLLLLAD